MARDRAEYNKELYERMKADPEWYASILERKRARYAERMKDPVFVEQQREKARAWARENTDKVRKTQRETQKKKFQWYVELKSGLKCERCGYDRHPAALDFHHLNPSTKSFSIGVAVRQGMPETVVREEIEKCQVLCKNCHAELHNERER